jgi:hypothetical protein
MTILLTIIGTLFIIFSISLLFDGEPDLDDQDVADELNSEHTI